MSGGGYVLGVSVPGVHVQGVYVLEPIVIPVEVTKGTEWCSGFPIKGIKSFVDYCYFS